MPLWAIVALLAFLAASGIYLTANGNGLAGNNSSSNAAPVGGLLSSGGGEKAEGTLEGTMTIGPICPVERVGIPCKPTPETFALHKVYLLSEDEELITLTPDKDGKFSATLPPGLYIADINHEGLETVGSVSGVPAAIPIKSGQTATLVIDIDTGIRSPSRF